MDKFIYEGKYDGVEENLPAHAVEQNEVAFHEFEDMKTMSAVLSGLALGLLGVCIVLIYFRVPDIMNFLGSWQCMLGILFSFLVLVPHELIHALFFEGDVHFYQNLSQGMLFVTGTKEMSKKRFILMSLAPNIVFGFIPFFMFLFINRDMIFLGSLGAASISSGAGDFYNVYNTIRQVPSNGYVYLRGIHSYWYVPEKKAKHKKSTKKALKEDKKEI